MLKTLRGSPVISTALVLLFMSCPIVVAISSELSADAARFLVHPAFGAFFPGTFFGYIICLSVLLSVRHVEHMIGSVRTLVLVCLAWAVDVATRYATSLFIPQTEVSTCPYTLLMVLLSIYCVLFPSVRSVAFHMNEKVVLFVAFAAICALGGVASIPSVVSGFLVFCFTAPIYLPAEDKRD